MAADPQVLSAYFSQVASYEHDRLKGAERTARAGFIVGGVGTLVGLLGVTAVIALTPLKTIKPLVFRVDNSTGVVERVFDVKGGDLSATEASTRYFLWQYVKLRQGYNPAEVQANFQAVTHLSSPSVQSEYAADFRGSNPNSPQVLLGRDGTSTTRWVSTSFLGAKLAQVRFVQLDRRGDVQLPQQRMVATIGYDFAPGEVSSSAINVNPLGFVVTSYRADMEAPQ